METTRNYTGIIRQHFASASGSYRPVGKGATSTVIQIEDHPELIVKILTNANALEDYHAELAAYDWLSKSNLNCVPKLIAHDSDPPHFVLTKMGEPIAPLVAKINASRYLREHLSRAIALFTSTIFNRAGMVHGDLSLDNILIDTSKNDLISFVDFKMLYCGNPTDNFAKLAATKLEICKEATEMFAAYTGVAIDPIALKEQALRLSHHCFAGDELTARIANIEANMSRWAP